MFRTHVFNIKYILTKTGVGAGDDKRGVINREMAIKTFPSLPLQYTGD
jgi:hypothetical protein